MGQVLQAGAGPDPGPPGRGEGRHPDERPVADDQQGLPVGPGRDRAGRPADPRRRVRHHGGRRHGVDDQRPAPAAQVAPAATSTAPSRCSTPWPTTASPTPSTTSRWGSRPSSTTPSSRSPAPSRTSSPPARTSGPPRRRRTACFDEEIVPVADPAAQGRPGRVRARTRASAPTPPPSRSGKLRPAFSKDGTITAGLGLADLRRRRRGRRDEQGQGRGARAARGWPRSARTATSPAPTTPCSPSRPTPSRTRCARTTCTVDRPRPHRDQRGVRRGRHPVDEGPRRRPTRRQRQRRRDRPRAPDRDVRAPGSRCHLALELKRRGGGTGAAALCGGGGQGDALILHVPA